MCTPRPEDPLPLIRPERPPEVPTEGPKKSESESESKPTPEVEVPVPPISLPEPEVARQARIKPTTKGPIKLPPKPPPIKYEQTVFQKKRRRRRPFRRRLRLPPIQPGDQIHFKNTNLLRKFVSEKGKILSRKVTKLTFKQQRLISIAIKQARILSLLPFVSNYKIFERIKPIILRSAKFRNKKKKFDPKRKNRSFFRKK